MKNNENQIDINPCRRVHSVPRCCILADYYVITVSVSPENETDSSNEDA